MLNWSKYFFDQFLHRYLDQLFEGNWPVATSEHWTSQHTSTELGHARATLPILILHGQHWYWHFTWYKTPSEIDEAIKWDGNRQVVTVVLTELGHAQAMVPRHAHHFCLLALHIVLQYRDIYSNLFENSLFFIGGSHRNGTNKNWLRGQSA